MILEIWAKRLNWLIFVGIIIAGAWSFRHFSVSPELRLPRQDALAQLLPYLLMLLIVVTQFMKTRKSTSSLVE